MNEGVERKIRALLAKTTDNGATEAEMSAAMEKAASLMALHGIVKLKEEGSRAGFGRPVKGPFSRADGWLADAAATLFACRLVGVGKRRMEAFVFVGDEDAREVARSCFLSLRSQVASLVLQARRAHRFRDGIATSRSYVRDFRMGCGMRVLSRAKLWVSEATSRNNATEPGVNAVVVRGYFENSLDEANKFLREQEIPEVDNSVLNKFPDSGTATLEGYRAGANVVLKGANAIAQN